MLSFGARAMLFVTWMLPLSPPGSRSPPLARTGYSNLVQGLFEVGILRMLIYPDSNFSQNLIRPSLMSGKHCCSCWTLAFWCQRGPKHSQSQRLFLTTTAGLNPPPLARATPKSQKFDRKNTCHCSDKGAHLQRAKKDTVPKVAETTPTVNSALQYRGGFGTRPR